jgi:hypothetical protein
MTCLAFKGTFSGNSPHETDAMQSIATHHVLTEATCRAFALALSFPHIMTAVAVHQFLPSVNPFLQFLLS